MCLFAIIAFPLCLRIGAVTGQIMAYQVNVVRMVCIRMCLAHANQFQSNAAETSETKNSSEKL